MVTQDGSEICPRKNGILGQWPHKRKTSENFTVSDFRNKFEKTYPGFSCTVGRANGTTATGQLSLKTVRKEYE